MKKILVPISFSETSKNALIWAYTIAAKYKSTIHLLHCYPLHEYDRVYDFKGGDYDKGIRKMLLEFYNESIENDGTQEFKLITSSSSVSEVVAQISSQYNFLVLSRKFGFEGKKNNYLSDKIYYISTKALCPVFITSMNQKEFFFEEAKNIWHIQRNELEKDVINNEISHFGIDPNKIETKSLTQKNFTSNFWKNVVEYTKNHDDALLNIISKSYEEEQIDLLILVNRMKGQFSFFLKDEAFQIISQFDVPILIFQNKL